MNRILENITVNKIVLAMYVLPGTGARVHNNRPSHGLAFVVDGKVDYVFDKTRTLPTGAGTLIYLPKYSNYEVFGSYSHGVYAINFDTAEDFVAPPFTHKFTNPDEIKKLYRQAIKSFLSRDKSSDYTIKSIIYKILSTVIYENENRVSGSVKDKIAPAVGYIKENYADKQIYITHLANLCNMSETYFRRIFLKAYGMSPLEYILNLKYGYAAELLKSGEYSVHEVALLTGFPDDSSFSRFFKKMSGVPPTKA